MNRQTPRGFPQLDTTSGNGRWCRYHLPGELGRSLLKDRYVHDNAQHISLARSRGQISAQLCLPAGAGAGIRGYAAGRAAAPASNPVSPGERWVFALPAGDRTATVAVRTGAAAGFVDAPWAGCTAPAIGDGRYGRNQRSFCQACGAVSWRRRCRVGATSNNAGRGHPGGAGRTRQGPGKKGNAGSFA